MKKSLIIQSIFCAIACTATIAQAKTGFSGWLRMDSVLDQKINSARQASFDAPNRWDVSRARLSYTKDWDRWVRKMQTVVELHIDAEPTSFVKESLIVQSQSLSYKTYLSQAYVGYSLGKDCFRFGLIEAPYLSQESTYASLGFDQPIGTIIGFGGYHLGVAYDVMSGPYSAIFSIWQQSRGLSTAGGTYQSIQNFSPVSELVTPSALSGALAPQTNLDSAEIEKSLTESSFSSQYIPFSFGGRANYYLRFKTLDTLGFSFAAAHQKLSYPLLLAVLYDPYQAGQAQSDQQSAVPASGAYRLASFKSMNHYHIECLRTLGHFRASAGYSEQVLPKDLVTEIMTNDTNGGVPQSLSSPYVLEDGGRIFGYYIEAGHLLFGKGFAVDRSKNAVSSIVLGPAGWGLEIGARWGMERRRNIFALMDVIGSDDFSSSSYSDTSGEQRFVSHGIQQIQNTSYQLVCVDNQSPAYIEPLVENHGTLFGLGSVTQETKSFQTLVSGLSIFIQYYPGNSIAMKAEFDWKHYQKRIYLRDHDYVDSVHFKNIRTFKLRLESVF